MSIRTPSSPISSVVQISSSSQVTQLLARWSSGDSNARQALILLVYDELRRLARAFLARQRSDHTLQSKALVQEDYMRLIGHTSVHFENRAYFFAVSAQLMRRSLATVKREWTTARTWLFDEMTLKAS